MNNISKIILIIIDTLRADHLGCYGYKMHTSPNIDKFAEDAVLYKYAFSPSSYTIPVFASIITSKTPSNHSLGFRQQDACLNLNKDITAAEILKNEGFETAAFLGSDVLRKDTGFDAGFDIYDDHMTSHEENRPEQLIRDSIETNEAVFNLMGKRPSSKYFTVIHYFDVHGPYWSTNLKNPFNRELYGSLPRILEKVPNGFPGGIPEYQLLRVLNDEHGTKIDYEKDMRYYLSLYDGGVKYCDEMFGRLLNGLKEKKLYDDTMIILTSDHGEALGENNVYFFHGLTVSFEQIRVPLIIKFPQSIGKGQQLEMPVSTLDILPTILDSCGIDSSRFELEGQSLINLKNKATSRFILSENQWQWAIIKGKYLFLVEKRISDPSHIYYYDSRELCKGKRLYNYINDPSCTHNLVEQGIEASDFLDLEFLLPKYFTPKELIIQEMQRHLEEKSQLLSEANNQLDLVLSSWSWKITSPLRWVYRIIFGN